MSNVIVSSITRTPVDQGGGVWGGLGAGTVTPPSGDWQVPLSNYTSSKFDLEIAHPRPESETNAWEAYRNAYPSVAYSSRVLVFGGSYPFKFELVNAPSGMTIGETLVQSGDVLIEPDNYGKLEWSTPTAGSHQVTVRVYDQDYNRGENPSAYQDIAFTLVVGVAGWLFIDPVSGNDSTGDGAIGNPYKTTYALHNDTALDTSSQGTRVYFRGGTNYLRGMADTSSNYRFTGNQAGVFIGYPNESVVVEFDSGHFVTASAGFTLKDVEARSAAVAYGDSQKMTTAVDGAHRASVYDCTMPHFELGGHTAANGGVFVSLASTPIDYPCFAYNTLSGQQGSGWHTYEVNKAVVHGNSWVNATFNQTDGSNHAAIFFKDSTKAASVRVNSCWDGITVTTLDRIYGFGGQNDGGDLYGVQNLEWCYNTFAWINPPAGRSAAFREYSSNNAHGNIDNYHFYRNSFSDESSAEVSQTVTNSTKENNVLQTGAFPSITGVVDSNNLDSGSYLDSSMKLTGASRTSYLGTHGAEVAG